MPYIILVGELNFGSEVSNCFNIKKNINDIYIFNNRSIGVILKQHVAG